LESILNKFEGKDTNLEIYSSGFYVDPENGIKLVEYLPHLVHYLLPLLLPTKHIFIFAGIHMKL